MTFKIVNYFVLIFNLCIAVALVGSYLAPYISPTQFWPVAFLGLAFPLIVLVNFLLLLYWVVQKSKWLLISLITALAGIQHIPSFIQIGSKTNTDSLTKKVNIISFNTHYMGAFDHINNDTAFFFEELNRIKPDIICFQEFANLGGNYETPLFRNFFKQYKHFGSVNADGLSDTFPTGYGVCIFSRYPIINKGFVELINKNSNLTIFADVVINNDTIRIINTHLKSIVFEKQDYQTIEEIKEVNEGPEVGKVKRIGSKLKYAFVQRALQVDEIRREMNKSPYKIVVCGDFNDSPASYAYHTVKGDLKDAFKESGFGMSRTYIGKMPSFRIDYILHDPSFESFNYLTHTLNFSDHKMISCSIEIR
ncbi:MAG: endonuclease/exonuclease/phosphatase family protein [Bacteroidia bacterium]|nr:endonuclease/exonuclease/phosphatase family protein [Bacteroidia bacterium]